MPVLPFPGLIAGSGGLTLSDSDTVLWAQQAGFTGPDLSTAVAVSIAEDTARRIDATHRNSDGSTDYGLWQINDKAHPDLFTQYPQWWSATNAMMAHSIVQNGGGWNAWTTYKSGAYKQYLTRASQAVGTFAGSSAAGTAGDQQTGQVDTTNVLTSIGNSVSTIAGDVYKAAAWLASPHNWARIAFVALGGIILIGTVVKVSSQSQTVRSVASTAKKAGQDAFLL